MTDRFQRISAREVAWGWVPGTLPNGRELPTGARHPREVLEDVLRDHLARPPCFVAFSGGRDSSALLALAVRVARREGLADPVPLTVSYDHVPATDETSWQDLVVGHLGLGDWVRLSLGSEADLLGPEATSSLRRHGLLWPPTIHTKGPLFRAARGGSLLTGNGGDELFGPVRATPIARLLTEGPRGAGRMVRRQVLVALAPRRLRRRWWQTRQQVREAHPWLREAAAAELTEVLLTDLLDEPLAAGGAVGRVPRRRGWVIGQANLRAMADTHQVRYEHPLLDHGFVAALARTMPSVGSADRAGAMRRVFGEDLLPQDVLERTSKAYFNDAAVNEHSRRFAHGWTGAGVPTELVDVARLRSAWLGATPPAPTMMLLHAAWLGRSGPSRGEATGRAVS